MRLGISPGLLNPHRFLLSKVRGFISLCWYPRLYGLSCPQLFLLVYLHANVVLPALPPSPLPAPVLWLPPCRESSPPQLPISTPLTSLNVSSLTSWLLDFLTVGFSGSSGYLLLLNLLSSFWLCEEVKCIYLCLHRFLKSSLFSLYLLF